MLLVLSFAWALDDTIFLGPGEDSTTLAALQARGVVRGRTGALVGRVADPDGVRALPQVAGVERLRGGLVRIHPRPGVDDLALARALHARADVEWVHPDLILHLRPSAPPDDPWLADEWHLDNTGQGGRIPDVDINAPLAWQFATGQGILIAVLDTGVEVEHPDLRVIAGHDYIGRDDDPSPDPAYSGAAHGTGAAGIAAATGDNGYGVAGVAWGAEVYAIRLIGGDTSSSDLYDAFTEAVDAGAHVLSNSWGFYGCDGVPASQVFTEMYGYAEREGRDGLGSVVVFAAGNDNCNNSNDAMLSNIKAVVVAASEWNDERAWYSNYGDHVDITAPTGVLTTDLSSGGYGSYGGDDAFADGFSGTSGATPVVAGVVALMLEANPRLTAKQVRTVLTATATRLDLADGEWDETGFSPYYGYGRVDAGAAVAAVAATAPAAPVPELFRDPVSEGRVILAWQPAVDPDQDVQRHVVRWWREGTAEAEAEEQSTTATHLDLGAAVAAGDTVHWKVAGVDTWGEGAWSEPVTFTVVERPEPEADAPADTGDDPDAPPAASCSVVPSAASGLGLLFAIGFSRVRARAPAAGPSRAPDAPRGGEGRARGSARRRP